MQLNIFEEPVEDDDTTELDQELISRRALAAEHFVCFDLLFNRNVQAFLVSGQLPYDLIIEHNGLKRLQVKSRAWPCNGKYTFGGYSQSYSRRKPGTISRGLVGLLAYKDLVDGIALVAMDLKRIRYIPIQNIVTGSINLHPTDFGKDRESLSWNQLLHSWSK